MSKYLLIIFIVLSILSILLSAFFSKVIPSSTCGAGSQWNLNLYLKTPKPEREFRALINSLSLWARPVHHSHARTPATSFRGPKPWLTYVNWEAMIRSWACSILVTGPARARQNSSTRTGLQNAKLHLMRELQARHK